MKNLFSIADEEFYFDIDKISDYIRIDQSVDELLHKTNTDDVDDDKDDDDTNTTIQDLQMIDVAKWEVIKALMESILSENGVIDEKMGFNKLESQLSIPFRLSFNTLLKHKIIKKNGI